MNGAASSTYRPASAPKDVMSSMTLYIGLRCPTTPIEAATAIAANVKNANVSISVPEVTSGKVPLDRP